MGAPPTAKKGSREERRPNQLGTPRGAEEAGERRSTTVAVADGDGLGKQPGQDGGDVGDGGDSLCPVCGGQRTAGAEADVIAADRRRNDGNKDASDNDLKTRERGQRDKGHYCCSFESDRGDTNNNNNEDAGGSEGCNGDDFSVSYALHYPNECADPALLEEDLTVGEHVDPSLFVAEPCCGVEGLEIQDRATGRWEAIVHHH